MKTFFRQIAKVLLCLVLVSPALTSCYDDSELWGAVDELTDRVTKLEADLKAQADAMSSLLSDGSTIAKCEKQTDGSYVVTLSNGTKFKVLSTEANYSALMTYVEVGGSKYWAVYGPTGEVETLKDAEGKNIPVSVKVDVTVKDGKYFLVINGVEYETGYEVEELVQVYESCTPHTDASGNVYALTFSFGEGMDVTVSVDGYKGVIFKLENAGTSSILVSEYYIPYGSTQSFLIDVEGVVDYVMQIPYGWKVVERVDKQTGNTYLDITAPARAVAESGAAFESGDLKVVAVVEGGDAVVSKLVLSAVPFKNLEFSSTMLVVEPYAGVQKFVYGIIPLEEYSQEQVLATAQTLVSSSVDAPAGYAVADAAVSLPLSTMLGAELDENKKYMLFVVPAYYQEGDEPGFVIDAAEYQHYIVGAVSVMMSEPVASLFDAEVLLQVKGTTSFWGGTAVKSETVFDDIIYGISNDIYKPYAGSMTFEGKASEFPSAEFNASVEFQPGTTYVVWCVPYDDIKTTYSVKDIVYKEFTTNSLSAGGSLVISAEDPVVTKTSISVNISAEGASAIYYAYLTDDEGKRLASVEGMDDTKFALMQKSENFTLVRDDEAVAAIEDIIPESTLWLYAAAVDESGKYGAVKCLSATLETVKYNSITLTLDSVEVGSDEAEFKVTATSGTPTGYIYWIGTQQDPFWVACNKSRLTAQKYMATYPEDDAISSVMRTHGNFASDGTIKITGLRLEEEYVMLVLAQDESGLFSKAAYKKVTTLAADLGDVRVEGSDLWNTAKNSIVLEWIEESFESAASQGLMAQYAFNFSCPQDYTAYVMCASDTYFEEAGLNKMSQRMIEIENYASRKYDDGRTPMVDGVPLNEPDYYKDGELRQGQMMNVYSYYVHGLPSLGFATYFAPDSHGAGNCIYWDEDLGQDVNYQRALQSIADHCTLAPYERRAAAFGLQGQEAADWAQALLEAYLPFYEDAEPIVLVNDGSPLTIRNPYGTGVNDKGLVPDRVIVMLKDRQGNYFEPMMFEVPDYFTK